MQVPFRFRLPNSSAWSRARLSGPAPLVRPMHLFPVDSDRSQSLKVIEGSLFKQDAVSLVSLVWGHLRRTQPFSIVARSNWRHMLNPRADPIVRTKRPRDIDVALPWSCNARFSITCFKFHRRPAPRPTVCANDRSPLTLLAAGQFRCVVGLTRIGGPASRTPTINGQAGWSPSMRGP